MKTKKTKKVIVEDSSKVAKVINEKAYFATIKVMGKTYDANGATISEAISSLKPMHCKGRGIITIQHGDVKKERILTNVATFRLFSSHGLTKEVALKNVSLMFQGI